MKPKLLDRSASLNRSFNLSLQISSHFLKVWHHHPELELVLIKKSTGARFVGDSISRFGPGDLVLIGSHLPHMWQNDSIYFENEIEDSAETIACHFKEDFMGNCFANVPELKPIKVLLEKAKRGIVFMGKSRSVGQEILENMLRCNDFDRLVKLTQLLNILANEPEVEQISSPGFVASFSQEESRRLDNIYEYIHNKFKEDISLEKVAELASMNTSSFCRYFKKTTGKTFSHYLNTVRIGYACKLLIEDRYTISEICYESGFNNISNFNRQFKTITNYSPSTYSKLHNKETELDTVDKSLLSKRAG
jgi:AraC-like DNA-binding protein